MELVLTEMEKAKMVYHHHQKGWGKIGVRLGFGQIKYEMLVDVQVKKLNRQFDICVRGSGEKFKLNVYNADVSRNETDRDPAGSQFAQDKVKSEPCSTPTLKGLENE